MLYRTLFVVCLLGTLTACDAVTDDAARVSVSGTVTNASGLPVSDASVAFDTGTNKTAPTVTTGRDGRYTVDLDAGTYTVTISKGGYTAVTFSASASEGATVDRTISGPASVRGTVVNALTGDAVSNARVEFVFQAAAGADPTSAPVEVRAQTNGDGAYAFTGAPFGTYVCIVTVTGETPFILSDIEFLATGETNLGQGVVTPLPAAGEYRVVLTWGEAPSDLDTHFTGPSATGDRFHVYFSDRTPAGGGGTNLDVDDVTSFGPETLTILPPADGLYRYSVFNYTNQGTSGAQGIATSPARVQVFNSNGLLRTYDAPSASPEAGNTWRVFEMTIANGTVAFSGATPSGLGYFNAEDSSDLGVFFRDLPAKAIAF